MVNLGTPHFLAIRYKLVNGNPPTVFHNGQNKVTPTRSPAASPPRRQEQSGWRRSATSTPRHGASRECRRGPARGPTTSTATAPPLASTPAVEGERGGKRAGRQAGREGEKQKSMKEVTRKTRADKQMGSLDEDQYLDPEDRLGIRVNPLLRAARTYPISSQAPGSFARYGRLEVPRTSPKSNTATYAHRFSPLAIDPPYLSHVRHIVGKPSRATYCTYHFPTYCTIFRHCLP